MESPLRLANAWFAEGEPQAMQSPPTTPPTLHGSDCYADTKDHAEGVYDEDDPRSHRDLKKSSDLDDVTNRTGMFKNKQLSEKEELQQKCFILKGLNRIEGNHHGREMRERNRTIEALEDEKTELLETNDDLRYENKDLLSCNEELSGVYQETLVRLEASEAECRRLAEDTKPMMERHEELISLAKEQIEEIKASRKEPSAHAERIEAENERLRKEGKAMEGTIASLRGRLLDEQYRSSMLCMFFLILAFCMWWKG